MMEQEGHVVAVRDGQAWIETQRRSGCEGCQARSGCGQGILSQWRRKAHRLSIDCGDTPLAVGDHVTLGVEERVYLRGVVLLYGAPLLVAILLGGIAERWAGSGTLLVPGGFALGLGIGFLGVYWHSRRETSRTLYRPKLLRRTDAFRRNG
ncbi:SoxR reducing system RseC family protein [Halomonas sp. WWR20]